MRTRIWTLMGVTLVLLLLPALITGCGSSDSLSDKKAGIFTVGPGCLDKFPVTTETTEDE